jgi:amidase
VNASEFRYPTQSARPLEGTPIVVKDNSDVAQGLNTTAGSLALLSANVISDAPVIESLRRAGAIILRRAAMTAWAAGRSTSMTAGWSA